LAAGPGIGCAAGSAADNDTNRVRQIEFGRLFGYAGIFRTNPMLGGEFVTLSVSGTGDR
jgi:hypothetical protein